MGNLIFIVPFAIIPVIIRTFYDSRLALFILLITVMLSGLVVVQAFEFILMSFISGMVAIFTLTNIYKRTRLFFTSACNNQLIRTISWDLPYAQW